MNFDEQYKRHMIMGMTIILGSLSLILRNTARKSDKFGKELAKHYIDEIDTWITKMRDVSHEEWIELSKKSE